MKVKVVARQGAATLVEWVETGPYGTPAYRRSILPASEVRARAGEMIDVADPDQGAPAGDPWEELLEGTRGGNPPGAGVAERTAWEIANELRRLGIWTAADLEGRRQDAVAAFQRGYGMDAQRLREAARNGST